MADRIQLRRDTAANWTAYNPILLEGEPGIEIDTDQWKLGDGVHTWSQLAYRGGECVQQRGQSTTVAMSQKAVTDELNLIGVFDISAHNLTDGHPTKYADLTAALGTNGANVPTQYRVPGMTIRYVQSSDNKYVQYRLMADEWSTNTEDWAIADEGVYVENPEFVYVQTDKNDKILWAIKTDGSIYYGAGVPQQVKVMIDEVNAHIDTKLDTKLDADGLDADALGTMQAVENPEYITVTTDSDDKILEGITSKGVKQINVPIDTPSATTEHVESPEWIKVLIDAQGRIIAGVKKDGSKYEPCDVKYPNGIPNDIKNYIDNYTKNFINRTSYQRHLASNLGLARKSTWDEEHGFLPVDWIAPLVFLHISDTHIGGSTYRPQTYNAVNTLNLLSVNNKNNGMNAKFLINTGDICNNNFREDISNFTKAVEEANKPVFIAIGNHDVGNSKTISICGTDTQVYDKFIKPYIDNWNLTTENEGTPHPIDKCYYFKDFTDEKIRLIVLYEYESDFELDPNDSSKLKYQRGYRAFRQAQIDWLIESLMTTPDDYGVIIAKHQQENQRGITKNSFNPELTYGGGDQFTYVDKNIIAEIIDAFINKSVLVKDYSQTGEVVTTLNVNADFSVKNNTEFICYVSGHNHCDGISFLKDFPNQLELNIGCDNTHYTHGSDMLQVPDSLSEDLINVYSIDRNHKCICVVRIGANMSCMAQQRIAEKINYK